jgi:hypothetical protein
MEQSIYMACCSSKWQITNNSSGHKEKKKSDLCLAWELFVHIWLLRGFRTSISS